MVRPGAPWCTQCYLDLRVAAAPEPRPVAATTGAGWPCQVCHAVNDLGVTACAGCGADFLAGLRDPRPGLVLPGLGDVAALGTAQRFLLAGVVAGLLALLAVGLMTGVGLVV